MRSIEKQILVDQINRLIDKNILSAVRYSITAVF